MPLANINEPETEMLIWYIILATTIAVTCAGLLFLANRIARSPFTAKLDCGRQYLQAEIRPSFGPYFGKPLRYNLENRDRKSVV